MQRDFLLQLLAKGAHPALGLKRADLAQEHHVLGRVGAHSGEQPKQLEAAPVGNGLVRGRVHGQHAQVLALRGPQPDEAGVFGVPTRPGPLEHRHDDVVAQAAPRGVHGLVRNEEHVRDDLVRGVQELLEHGAGVGRSHQAVDPAARARAHDVDVLLRIQHVDDGVQAEGRLEPLGDRREDGVEAPSLGGRAGDASKGL